MPRPTPEQCRVYGKLGATISWANTKDPAARTKNARERFEASFLVKADGDEVLAARLRKAHFARMHLNSLKTRKAKRGDA